MNPLAPIYFPDFVLIAAFAIFFYKGAEIDAAPPLPWAALSLAASIAVWRGLAWGWLGIVGSQIAVVAGITLFRTPTER